MNNCQNDGCFLIMGLYNANIAATAYGVRCVPIIAHHHHPCIAMVTGIVSFVLRRMRREREPGKSCRRRLEKQHSPE